MAASTASHRPIKGILKNQSSVRAPAEQPRRNAEELRKKSQRWDETNIQATYHPAGADCGLAKVDEPCPGAVGGDDDGHRDSEALTPQVSAEKLAGAPRSQPKCHTWEQEQRSKEGDTDLSPEEQEKKRQFEMKRKLHYNEGLNIKLARQLLSKDLHDD